MPLLSIEFAVFFIVFLPLYWAFARLPQVQNVLLLVAGLGLALPYRPYFCRADFGLLVCGLPGQRTDVF